MSKTKENKYPYYRVTKRLNHLDLCAVWFDHFISKRIPVCIVKDGNTYTVWAMGVEAFGDPDDESNHGGNREEIVGSIVRSSVPNFRWSSAIKPCGVAA